VRERIKRKTPTRRRRASISGRKYTANRRRGRISGYKYTANRRRGVYQVGNTQPAGA
jgi:hypothetical protein